MKTKKNLEKLYLNIHQCHICPLMNKEKTLRQIESTAIEADIFIIAQALAENTIRKSGINFIKPDGSLGNSGINLNKFLKNFDRTVLPGKKCVYTTDITQCYPGKNNSGGGDRKPNKIEIQNCIHFLLKELELIKPKIIFLLGKISCDTFYKKVLKKNSINNLSICIESIILNKIDYFNGIPIIPLQHPSGANPNFYKMLKNENFIKKIKELL